MREGKQIPIVIPSYEPDEKLLSLLKRLRENGFTNIVVVDDGSGEAYARFFDEAKETYQCKVLHHAVNQGKGRALKTAFNFCLQEFPSLVGVVTADSDGQRNRPGCFFGRQRGKQSRNHGGNQSRGGVRLYRQTV